MNKLLKKDPLEASKSYKIYMSIASSVKSCLFMNNSGDAVYATL